MRRWHSSRSAPPPHRCSVFKLRGVASGGAAEKVGVGKRELVDHVFYDGAELFNRGGPGLRLRATCQDGAEGPELDWLALLPNEVVPSDHLPVVWDFALKRFPRASAAALRDAAREELRPRLDLVPAALRVDVAGPDGKGGGLFGAWLREAERQAHAVPATGVENETRSVRRCGRRPRSRAETESRRRRSHFQYIPRGRLRASPSSACPSG